MEFQKCFVFRNVCCVWGAVCFPKKAHLAGDGIPDRMMFCCLTGVRSHPDHGWSRLGSEFGWETKARANGEVALCQGTTLVVPRTLKTQWALQAAEKGLVLNGHGFSRAVARMKRTSGFGRRGNVNA
jgi:hypothetical protein